MKDTLLIGNRVLINKLAYALQVPKGGDVVAFVLPHEQKILFMKRIVALENDTVEVKEQTLFVNSQPIEEDYIKHNGQRPQINFPPFPSYPASKYHPNFGWRSTFSEFDQ